MFFPDMKMTQTSQHQPLDPPKGHLGLQLTQREHHTDGVVKARLDPWRAFLDLFQMKWCVHFNK